VTSLHKAERGQFYADRPCTFRSKALPQLTESNARVAGALGKKRLGSAVPSESLSMHGMAWAWHGVANQFCASRSTYGRTLPPIRLDYSGPPLPVGLYRVVFSRLHFQRLSVLLKLEEALVVLFNEKPVAGP
jgi:hypothetical protein